MDLFLDLPQKFNTVSSFLSALYPGQGHSGTGIYPRNTYINVLVLICYRFYSNSSLTGTCVHENPHNLFCCFFYILFYKII